MRIVKEWLDDFVELRLSAEELKNCLADLHIPVKEIISEEENEARSAHMAAGNYILLTENEENYSYEALGSLLSLQNGCSFLSFRPICTGENVKLDEEQKKYMREWAEKEAAADLLLLETDHVELPEWLKRRLHLAGYEVSVFPEAVALYVNVETGSEIYVKKLSDRAFSYLNVYYVYYSKKKNDINERGLRRIRQIWEQHIPVKACYPMAE